jgi:hypothetical protein
MEGRENTIAFQLTYRSCYRWIPFGGTLMDWETRRSFMEQDERKEDPGDEQVLSRPPLLPGE